MSQVQTVSIFTIFTEYGTSRRHLTNRLFIGPLDPILASIAKRLEDETGRPFSEAQVLYLWQREKDVVVVT